MAALKPFVINADVKTTDANPHSWLILVGDQPSSAGPRCMVGTLRAVHQARKNSASTFAAAKLLVGGAASEGDWQPRAYRHEVLLPHDVDDRFLCPKTLFSEVDAAHVQAGKALVGYITLTWTPARLHQQWRLAHALAAELVEEHRVPALLVQHCPGLVASTMAPHCHILLAGPRVLTGIGWGGYVTALTGDRLWPLVRARFDALLAAS